MSFLLTQGVLQQQANRAGGPYALKFDGEDDWVDYGEIGSSIKLGRFKINTYFENGIKTDTLEGLLNLKGTSDKYAFITIGQFSSFTTDSTITISSRLGVNGQYPRTYIRDTFETGWHEIIIEWNESISKYDIYVDEEKRTTYKSESLGGHVHIDDFTMEDVWLLRDRGDRYAEATMKEMTMEDENFSLIVDPNFSNTDPDTLHDKSDEQNAGEIVGANWIEL